MRTRTWLGCSAGLVAAACALGFAARGFPQALETKAETAWVSKAETEPKALATSLPSRPPPEPKIESVAKADDVERVIGRGPDAARQATLDDALGIEAEDPTWTAEVQERVSGLLADVKGMRTTTTCAQTFCRVILNRPKENDIDWPEIDQRLSQVAVSEAVFNTKPESDGSSTGYLYFSALDTTLPLSFGQQED